MRLAALLTCHDRKKKTLSCLSSLFSIKRDCDVFLVDDGCTDGTSEAIIATYPRVNIIKGDGNLFWSRGMYTAWKQALNGDYDFYLWLNDDIELKNFSLEEMFSCYDLSGGDCIVSGLIGSPDESSVIYGGSSANKKILGESTLPQEITFLNGNAVLVPASVVNKIGILDPFYHHDLGDVDYGLLAQRNGIKVVTTRKIIAIGTPNPQCRIRKWGVSIFKRFKKLNSPLGSPLWINYYFRRKNYGIFNALTFCTYLIVLNILPDCMVSTLFGTKYKK